MRHPRRFMDETRAWQLLQQADVVQLATTTPQGSPLLRVLNAVVVDDWILFHGAMAGDKATAVGRPAVVSAHHVVADIPSTFIDPQLACPATTYYRSVLAEGRLENVASPELKARMLAAMMQKYQPAGGHAPILADAPQYRHELRAVRVFGLRVARITGKANLGQDRPAARTRQVVTGLWDRGGAGDLAAIEEILAWSPDARPEFLQGPHGTRFVVHPTPDDVAAHAGLVASEYWRQRSSRDAIEAAIAHSTAWVGLRDEHDALLAAARAVSDRSWAAWIYDVVVAAPWRERGLGRAAMTRLLDHPAVRGVAVQRLGTRDRAPFYEALGFQRVGIAPRDFAVTELVRQGHHAPVPT